MNRFILSIAFIILFGVFSVSRVLGQEVIPTATPSAKQEYHLPYPGILPDSPLWKLKALRDVISGMLIADPLKKAEFNLLQADKRLSAGIYLSAKGKNELALSTISKGENYFDSALERAIVAKAQGRETLSLLEKMKEAGKKHEEVIDGIRGGATGDFKTRAEKELERVKDFRRRVNKLLEQ